MGVGTGRPLVLVVDDDPDILASVTTILEMEGFEAARADDGQTALLALHGGLRPAVILLDLMMPGMNGWEFRAKQLDDDRLADIPVIVFSGDANVAGRSAELRATGFLRKPIDLETLLAAIESAVAGAPEGAA